MKIIDIVTAPWAIEPDKLIEIREIYKTHMRGDKIDLKGVEARLGRPLANVQEDYEIVNGVAIIPLHGVLAKRANMFMRISGGASFQIFQNAFNDALFSKDVKSIILDIDSPGGTVDGTFETSDRVFSARDEKPIIAFVDGQATSAAYSIASAASKVYVSGPAAVTGSIGVVATHIDISEFEKKIGEKTTEITAGRFKRIASSFEPLSKEGRANIQEQVDFLYSIFVEKVSMYRGVSVKTVLDDMADGRLFIGQQSIDAGLVDGITTIDSLIDQLSNGVHPNNLVTGALSEKEAYTLINHLKNDIEDDQMNKPEITRGYILENHPDIAEAFREEGAKALDVDKIRADAAEAERERIKSVKDQMIPGHEKLIESLMFDGKTTGPEAAVKILAEEKKTRTDKANDLEKDAPEPVKHVDTESQYTGKGKKVDSNLPIEERCKQEWENSPELRDEFGEIETYIAFEKAENNKQVHILKSA